VAHPPGCHASVIEVVAADLHARNCDNDEWRARHPGGWCLPQTPVSVMDECVPHALATTPDTSTMGRWSPPSAREVVTVTTFCTHGLGYGSDLAGRFEGVHSLPTEETTPATACPFRSLFPQQHLSVRLAPLKPRLHTHVRARQSASATPASTLLPRLPR
jgi:hypothetical protein